MFFPFQGLVDNLNAKRERAFDNIVQQHVQQARIQGYFTQDNTDDMKQQLAKVFYIDSNEITVNCTTTPKYRSKIFEPNELIHFEVSVPLKKIFVMQLFWGYSDSENTRNIVYKGDVSSERLP